MRYFYLFIVVFLVLSGCSNNKQPQHIVNSPRIVSSTGQQVNSDSLEPPVVIPVIKSKLKKVAAGKPVIVDTELNTHPASLGNKITPDKNLLTRITLGSDGYPFPQAVPAIDSPFFAGIPVTVMAKDPYIREQNSQNFSTYGKLQGLTHGNISVMTEDRLGNLWLGTYGGGVSRYDGRNFTHFTTKEGLSNNSILSIIEDRNGNLWFGTNGGGVNRYDGFNITQFTDKQGLSNNMVLCIKEEKEGNIWFGTDGGGASRYDGKTFTHFTVKEGLSGNSVSSIIQDVQNNIWFGTDNGISCFDGKQFIHFTEKEGLPGSKVTSLFQSKDQLLWIGTTTGMANYDGKKFTSYRQKNGLANDFVSNITEDSNGHIWISTNGGGVTEFDGKNFVNYTEKEGLASNSVRYIYLDRAGNLWMGTWGMGVSKLDRKRFSHYTDKEGLNHKVVSATFEDRSGQKWLATGVGISCYDGSSFSHYTEKQGLHNSTILSIMNDSKDHLWFGSLYKGVAEFDGSYFTHYTTADGLSHNDVRCILEDKNGNYWFATSGGGITCYDGQNFTQYTTKQGLSSNDVRSMLQDNASNFWFGTIGGGVTRFDGERFTHFSEKDGIGNNGVLSIFQDSDDIIWFGTNGGGVIRYDGKNFMQITEADGLSNNVVLSILEDMDGSLWFGTRFGICNLSKEEKNKLSRPLTDHIRFRSYSFEDGFFGIGVNGGKSLFQSLDGKLWIGANDRLTIYHPDRDVHDTTPPTIQLTGLSLFNETIDWIGLNDNKDSSILLDNGVAVGNFKFNGLSRWYNLPKELSLAHNNNYVTLTFIGITMNRPKKVRYQYMMDGIDPNWSAVTDRNEAPYGNLSPGIYTFKVKAMNSEGYWSQPLIYTFTVRPPWWRTWWAYATYIIIAVGSIAFYIRWRERSLKARQKELEQTVEERTAEVKEEKKLVEEKNKEILDSIAYARRIQSTILPSDKAFKANLSDSFVLYLPKDIVAGDFYWLERVRGDDRLFFAACDCTGHGVPGAMVSVVCHNALNNAIHEFGCRTPAEILDKTSEVVINDFNKNMELTDEVKDGMDASVCAFDPETGQLTWAGANNPLLLIRNGEQITEIKADKQHVGHSDKRKPYTNHNFQLEKGELIYLITDGFADQFGGPSNKKFQRAKLRELLFSVHHLPMEQQRSKLLSTFEQWRGTNEQVDDVTIIGVRV